MCTRRLTKFLIPLLYVALTAAAVQSATRVGGAPNINCTAATPSPPRLANAAAFAAAFVRPPFLGVWA
jgi:hypothetical protein